MIQNALAGAIFVYAVIAGVLLKECVFLAPLRGPLWEEFGAWIVGFSLVLILNLFAGLYLLFRKLALKNTGDKLSHLEKQLRGSASLSEELTERILLRK